MDQRLRTTGCIAGSHPLMVPLREPANHLFFIPIYPPHGWREGHQHLLGHDSLGLDDSDLLLDDSALDYEDTLDVRWSDDDLAGQDADLQSEHGQYLASADDLVLQYMHDLPYLSLSLWRDHGLPHELGQHAGGDRNRSPHLRDVDAGRDMLLDWSSADQRTMGVMAAMRVVPPSVPSANSTRADEMFSRIDPLLGHDHLEDLLRGDNASLDSSSELAQSFDLCHDDHLPSRMDHLNDSLKLGDLDFDVDKLLDLEGDLSLLLEDDATGDSCRDHDHGLSDGHDELAQQSHGLLGSRLLHSQDLLGVEQMCDLLVNDVLQLLELRDLPVDLVNGKGNSPDLDYCYVSLMN